MCKPFNNLISEGIILSTEDGMINVLCKNISEHSEKDDNRYDRAILDGFSPIISAKSLELVFRRESIEKFEKKILEDSSQSLTLDESLLIIGCMLNALKNATNSSKKWTQDYLKGEIEDKGGKVKSRTLDEYFAKANNIFKSTN